MYDIKAEAGVVGTLLINPSYYYHFEMLKPQHFHDKPNAIIYDVVKDILDDNSEDVSDFSVYLRISNTKAFEKEFAKNNIDIQDYLEKLRLVGTNDSDEYRARCKRVLDYAFKRDSIDKLKEIIGHIELSNTTANQTNMYIHDTIGQFSEQYIVGTDVKPFGEIIDELWEEILERQNPESGVAGIPSKIPIINQYFSY